MQKNLTITIDEQVYDGLHATIGQCNISQFIESLVRPHVISSKLGAAYQQMAADEECEAEALDWTEATLGDVPMNRAEVWWVNFDPAVGGEIRKQ